MATNSIAAEDDPFAQALRRARLRTGLTQAELAQKIQVTQTTVSNWEIGKVRPSQENQLEVEKVLGAIVPRDESETPTELAPPTLGVWLNKERLAKGMSVAELAVKAGVSVAAIYQIEGGRIENPRESTVKRLEQGLGVALPRDAALDIQQQAQIEGVGEFVDFDPHQDSDLPDRPGIYVFYDISDRPIYVGESRKINRRIREHKDKFWFRPPIVQAAAYVDIADHDLRAKIEKILIRFLKSNAVINKQSTDR